MSTFNPADKNAFITLSGGNLIATGNNASNGGVRGSTSTNSGKVVLQYDAVTLAGDLLDYIGIGSAAATLGLANGSQANQIIMISDGVVFNPGNSGGLSIGPDVRTGSTSVQFAFDFTHNMYWVRTTGGVWAPTTDPTDPVSGGGGVAMGSITAALFPYVRETGAGGTSLCTLNPNASNMPAGYRAWDGVLPFLPNSYGQVIT